MNQSQRHEAIVLQVSQSGFLTIEALAEQFTVTPQTIRRDINILAESGRVRRFHGGVGRASSTVNMAYDDRKVLQLAEKRRIAAAVASQIPNQSSMFINIGTTNEAIAQALLQHQDLRVITNNLNVATILTQNKAFEIIIAGGLVRNRDRGVTGEATIDFINQFRVDFGVIGISSIEEDGTLLDFDYHEVRVAQAIVANARQVILAADHTKFGRTAINRLGDLSVIDTLVTDQAPPQPVEEKLNTLGKQLVIAQPKP